MRGRFVLLALLAVLVAATACSGQAATPTTTASSTSPTSTTTTTVPPITTTTATRALVWSRAAQTDATFGGPGTQAISSLAVGGPGLVAVGIDDSDGDADEAAVWVSVDGHAWTRVHDPAVFGGPGTQAILAVAAGGPGFVAVGIDNSSGDQPEDWDAAVWVSVDGYTWTRIHDPAVFGGPGAQAISSLAVGGPGLVAVGSAEAGDDEDAAVWVSEDGYAWTRVDDEALSAPGGQAMNVVGAWRGGVVAFGVNEPGGDSEANAMWVSVDAYTWTRIDNPAVFGEPGIQVVGPVTAWGPGLVAFGDDNSSWGEGTNAALWVSADGYTWTRIDDEAFGGPGNQGINSVTARGPDLVAVGTDDSGGTRDAAVWVSSDGYTWTRIEDPAVFGGPGTQVITSVAAWGTGLVAVGVEESGEDIDAAVWIAAPATP